MRELIALLLIAIISLSCPQETVIGFHEAVLNGNQHLWLIERNYAIALDPMGKSNRCKHFVKLTNAHKLEINWYQNCPYEQGYPIFVFNTFMDGNYTSDGTFT